MADGNPVQLRGINTVGLEAPGFSPEDIKALRTAYRKIFLKKDQNLGTLVKDFESLETAKNTYVKELLAFISSSERGMTR